MVCGSITYDGDGTVCLPSQAEVIVAALQDSLQHTHLCDVTVSINGHYFHSHKFLLAAMSNFFQGYFSANTGELEVDISHLETVSKDSFQLFLRFVYTSKLLLQSLDDARGMLKLCRGLETSSLKEACSEYLKAKLTGDNCNEILSLAEEFNLPNLEKDAKGRINKLLIELHETYVKQDAMAKLSKDETILDNTTVGTSPDVLRPRTRRRKQLPTRSSTRANKSSIVPSDVPPGSKLRVETKAALKRFPRSRRKPALPVQIIHNEAPPLVESVTNEPELQNNSPRTQKSKTSNHENDSSLILTKKTRDCKVCDRKNLKTLKELQDHCRKEHVRCTKCKKLFATRSHLRQHMALHNKRSKRSVKKNYDCSICGKKFNYASPLQVHLRTHNGEKPFECKFCMQRFTQSINLYRHVLSYHDPDAPKYQCKICDKEFSVEIYLKSHEITHSEERPFQCEECGMLFKRKNDVQSHQRVHSSEKPHRCELCLSCFKTIGDLKAHLRIHNDSKPHCCKQCPKRFKRSGHLNRHMKTHSSDKPFKCGECNAAFKRKENLRTHLRTHTSAFPYQCDQCDARYKHSSSLKAHAKKHSSTDGAEQLYFIEGGKPDQSREDSQPLPTILETEGDVQIDASIALPPDSHTSLVSTQSGNTQSSITVHGGTKYLYLQNYHPSKATTSHTLIPLSDVFSEVGESAIAEATAGLPIPVVTLPKQPHDNEGAASLLDNTADEFVISR